VLGWELSQTERRDKIPHETFATDGLGNAMNDQVEIVCCVALGDAQVYHHLMPLANHQLVSRIWLVRTHLPRTGSLPNTSLVPVPEARRLRFPAMMAEATRLCRRPAVKGLVSFNPFPYALLGLPGAWLGGVSVHMGLIGSDWYRDAQRRIGPLLRWALRRADLVTVAGAQMRAQVLESGIPEDRIRVLPHAVDVQRFKGASEREVDFVFVGQLIRRKRVDRILRALAMVLKQHPEATLRVVGRGPLGDELRALARSLGVDESVDFVGYMDDVAPVLSSGRVFVMASEREGLPFALIEAQCAGLVPISTPVGTIADHLRHGVDGFIVESIDDLAAHMALLLGEPNLLERMRAATLQTRERYSYDSAARVWTPWLEHLVATT
jgi:glycosyltransferase involved in cell wall biosynthesis